MVNKKLSNILASLNFVVTLGCLNPKTITVFKKILYKPVTCSYRNIYVQWPVAGVSDEPYSQLSGVAVQAPPVYVGWNRVHPK
jgi:hypothetical protein